MDRNGDSWLIETESLEVPADTMLDHFKQVPIDSVRAYWDKRPCNLRHSCHPIGSKAYFDAVEARKYFVEPHILTFANFDQMAGKKVLEIGCGIGVSTVRFARSGAEVTAVDLSPESLKIARMGAQVAGVSDRIHFYQANAEELSKTVPIALYDVVYSFGVIHHSPHPERILDEVKSYLKPGGQLKIMLYHRRSWKVGEILFRIGKCQFWKAKKLIADHSEAAMGCPVTYTYCKKEGIQLLTAQGFHVTQVQVDHIFPYRVQDYVSYCYVKKWYFRWMPPQVFRWLEKRLGWHLCITAVKPLV